MREHDLLFEVRKTDNLYRAWTSVRANVIASGHEKFRSQVKEISENPIPYLRKIQSALQADTFRFFQQRGGLKKRPGKTPRPLVVAPIDNRIVQRAILNVLQSEEQKILTKLGQIPETLRTATSVGGIPKRGVPYAIAFIQNAIRDGATHYLRSDIREFFTKVPKNEIITFIHQQTGDKRFSEFFQEALSTELENGAEVKEYIHLFPTDDVGVPQGSSLSAFAGNVVLRDFDAEMNGRGITTIRYIDDFVILGKSLKTVNAAFLSAKERLKRMGMDAYGPDENPNKAKAGNIQEGFDFLGCSIRSGGVSPSAEARSKFISGIEGTLACARKALTKFETDATTRRAEDTFAQSLSRIDRKIRGWGDAFSFCNDRLPFHQMDAALDTMIATYMNLCRKGISTMPPDKKRRMYGIALLKDTPASKKGALN